MWDFGACKVYRVSGLGFLGLTWLLSCAVYDLGFRVSGFRVSGFRVSGFSKELKA